MTRERLWKRLLYGTQLASMGDRNKKVHMYVDNIIFSCSFCVICHVAGFRETDLFRILLTIIAGQGVSTGYVRFSTDSV